MPRYIRYFFLEITKIVAMLYTAHLPVNISLSALYHNTDEIVPSLILEIVNVYIFDMK